MAHPNADLSQELKRCIAIKDPEQAVLLATPGKRKGFLISSSSGSFELTPKGKEFVAKWGK